MAPCKHCGGLSDNSSIFADIDSLSTTSNEDLWAIAQTFDTEIARVEALLNELLIKRALLKKKINRHLSPLIRIPSDITSEIFKVLLKHEGETEGGESWRQWEYDSSLSLALSAVLGENLLGRSPGCGVPSFSKYQHPSQIALAFLLSGFRAQDDAHSQSASHATSFVIRKV